MTMLDDMIADPTHYMHGTTKGWQLGCWCERCAKAAEAMREPDVRDNKRERWSEQDVEELARLASRGARSHEIAKALGRTACAVTVKAVKLGIKLPRNEAWTPEEEAIAFDMRRRGHTCAEIAEAVGRTDKAVNVHLVSLRRKGVEVPPKPRKASLASIHGTNSRYHAGCRCDECRAAHAAYVKECRRRKKESA